MKRRFIISAIYTSPPGTMGGNTKIMIEIIKNLFSEYEFVIITTEPETFKKNIPSLKKSQIITVPYKFKKFSYFSHYSEIKYIRSVFEKYLEQNPTTKNDIIYSCSDFGPDVLPLYFLKKKYTFKWIASLFLFIPTPFENIKNHYNFPLFKYIVYYIYQRFLFSKMKKRADLFLITNEYDKKFFPSYMRKKIYPIYGGVNLEEIEKTNSKDLNNKNIYDAIFCSRLHPQKGVSGLLDVWSMVCKKFPEAKLCLIGNGDENYVKFLKEKAKNLGIKKNIDWLGYVNGIDKYKLYKSSKLLVHPTVYDNNGMVAAEALCTGLPVVMYDLPQLKKIYTKGCVKVMPYDKNKYADSIISLFEQKKYNQLKPSTSDVSGIREFWSWKNRVREFNTFIHD